MTTTSTEEENLYPIWKFGHGLPVYNDPTRIPFSISYYNWFFFDFYGAAAAFFLHLFRLGDPWLPTVARLLTFSFAIAGSVLYFAILRQNRALRDFCPAYLLAALGLIATLNPLFGFWVMTARPDVGALAFELAGLFLLVTYLRQPRLALPLIAGLAFYLAWSFKQTAVTGLAASALTLALHRRPVALALMLPPWIILVALSLYFGGHDYRYCVLTAQSEFPIHFRNGLGIFLSTVAKMPLIALVLILLLAEVIRLARAGNLHRLPPEETLFLLATGIALLFGLITAGKDAAAENYFFPFSAWSGLWLFWALPRLGRTYFAPACLGVTALIIGGIVLVFLGRVGMIDRRAQHASLLILAQKIHHLPSPVYVTDTYGDLPWIQPNPPYFVVADIYSIEEKIGEIDRSGDLEALMARGYFGTIVTLRGEKLGENALARYDLADHDATYDYYVRK
jgi:hypothetical protein